ncbi:MAG TPA: DUF2628 domain-containing protein [Xanthobacteraceae bacterium]|jgi:hypothetical protein|nr:DUF2628 domain-containing protein [Xanthobacteraceae bacterium]
MSVYTVHEPPQRMADDAVNAERFVFVRDGFSFWAFLFAPLWMLWHRMWLVLLGFVVVSVALETLVKVAGASAFVVSLIGLLISLLVGLEAGTLRRFTLGRRGWSNVGVVSGDDVEDAERRFFDAWVRRTPTRSAGLPATTASAPSAPGAASAPPRMPQQPDVVGLFPEPGANR